MEPPLQLTPAGQRSHGDETPAALYRPGERQSKDNRVSSTHAPDITCTPHGLEAKLVGVRLYLAGTVSR